MAQKSKIEWTDATWNPVRGCTKISPGCKHCYAETFAERWRGIVGHPYEQGFDLRLVPERLYDPFRWVRSRMIFVNSMSDMFHEGVPNHYVGAVFRVMAQADWHIYQVLTKRGVRLRDLSKGILATSVAMQHIWLGVSVEDRQHGLPRIEHLRESRAAVRFLSIEPLLEELGELDLRGIDWVIVGGESGRGARSMRAEWVRDIRVQCAESKIPFFFKQWGGVHKSRTGRSLDGRTYDELPSIAPGAIPSMVARRSRLAKVQKRLGDGISGLQVI